MYAPDLEPVQKLYRSTPVPEAIALAVLDITWDDLETDIAYAEFLPFDGAEVDRIPYFTPEGDLYEYSIADKRWYQVEFVYFEGPRNIAPRCRGCKVCKCEACGNVPF